MINENKFVQGFFLH